MKSIIELDAEEAKKHFLKGSSYFNGDFPDYISFEPILKVASDALRNGTYHQFRDRDSAPEFLPDVNYNFVANKDGRFAWRPYELIHPVIYVSLVNLICSEENWRVIVERFNEFQDSVVSCCSLPVISESQESDQATQIIKWWKKIEQQSLCYSLEFSHILHTDVTDCYGSLYTHSIAWALHGFEEAKNSRGRDRLLGDRIDEAIRAGRYGQTNGISQGSVLMDFIAEIVLGYVDVLITQKLSDKNDFRILRYRDDYRIFTNSDVRSEEVLKVISDSLREVGMRLGVSKTFMSTNVIEGSIKPEKLAGIDLKDLGETNAKTLQKQLLRLHSFGRRFPNSGALRRLIGELHSKIIEKKTEADDLEVQVAIATDIAFVSPQTFPVIAGILSHLISLQGDGEKAFLWEKVYRKMKKIPYNGYLEIWLQRVTKPATIGIEYVSDEPICKIVNGEKVELWNNTWITNQSLVRSLDVSKIVVADATKATEIMALHEVMLFKRNAEFY